MRPARSLVLLLASLLLAAVVTACGGDGGESDEDPATVLRETFTNDQEITSGSFDLALDVSAEGGESGGDVELGLEGPFQGRDGDVPAFDVEAQVNAETPVQDVDFTGSLISTGQAAFVSYQDTDYQVPQELFDRFASRFVQLQRQSRNQGEQDGNFLASLGIDPTNWLTNLENEGIEEVGGVETIHVSGEADVDRLVDDLGTIVRRAGPAAEQVDPAQLEQLSEVITEAQLDVFSGEEDRVLRRIEANLELDPPDAPGSPDSVSIGLSLSLAELNEPQTIEAPEGAEPLDNLLRELGLDPEQLGGAVGQLPQAGGSPQAPAADATQQYLQCLREAQGAAATQACAEILQQ